MDRPGAAGRAAGVAAAVQRCWADHQQRARYQPWHVADGEWKAKATPSIRRWMWPVGGTPALVNQSCCFIG